MTPVNRIIREITRAVNYAAHAIDAKKSRRPHEFGGLALIRTNFTGQGIDTAQAGVFLSGFIFAKEG